MQKFKKDHLGTNFSEKNIQFFTENNVRSQKERSSTLSVHSLLHCCFRKNIQLSFYKIDEKSDCVKFGNMDEIME